MNKFNRGNAETVGQAMLFVGVILIVLAVCAGVVWPDLVASDTAPFNGIAGAAITLIGMVLFFASRK